MKVARRNIRRASTVIVSCRWPKARALSAVEGDRRCREPNDLDQGSKLCLFTTDDCYIFKDRGASTPEGCLTLPYIC